MNKRLENIIKFISDGIGVIDVGTDHGYIPIYLSLNGYKGNIIASDINIEPLNKAKSNARENEIFNIDFLLSDGLLDCNPDTIDTIVIAGLGGDTICKILDQVDWVLNSKYKLILQPMTKSEVLRYWLINNGFSISYEKYVKDLGKIYSIINASFTGFNEKYSDAELYTGKCYFKNSELFDEYLNLTFTKILKILKGLELTNDNKRYTDFYNNILDGLGVLKSENS